MLQLRMCMSVSEQEGKGHEEEKKEHRTIQFCRPLNRHVLTGCILVYILRHTDGFVKSPDSDSERIRDLSSTKPLLIHLQ